MVKRHISSVVSTSPSKAVATLENNVSELIASGMVTLNAKLMGVDDDRLVGRVVETWGFFWDQVLTYVEGVCVVLRSQSDYDAHILLKGALTHANRFPSIFPL